MVLYIVLLLLYYILLYIHILIYIIHTHVYIISYTILFLPNPHPSFIFYPFLIHSIPVDVYKYILIVYHILRFWVLVGKDKHRLGLYLCGVILLFSPILQVYLSSVPSVRFPINIPIFLLIFHSIPVGTWISLSIYFRSHLSIFQDNPSLPLPSNPLLLFSPQYLSNIKCSVLVKGCS